MVEDRSRRVKVRLDPGLLHHLLGLPPAAELVDWRITPDPDALWLYFADDAAPRQMPDSETQVISLHELRNRDYENVYDHEAEGRGKSTGPSVHFEGVPKKHCGQPIAQHDAHLYIGPGDPLSVCPGD